MKTGNFEAVHPGPNQEGLRDLLGYETIKAVTNESGRRYFMPGNNKISFPSITTVLSINSEDSLEKWRKRVGEEEAREIARTRAALGEMVHESAERYIYGLDWTRSYEGRPYMPNVLASVNPIIEALDANLGKVWAQEAALYSEHLGLAGRVDLVAEWGPSKRISIIDFKTSMKPKKYEWVHNYFMQESGYAVMWEERTGMPIDNLVTIISVDAQPHADVFVEKRDDWIEALIDTKLLYDRKNLIGV